MKRVKVKSRFIAFNYDDENKYLRLEFDFTGDNVDKIIKAGLPLGRNYILDIIPTKNKEKHSVK